MSKLKKLRAYSTATRHQNGSYCMDSMVDHSQAGAKEMLDNDIRAAMNSNEYIQYECQDGSMLAVLNDEKYQHDLAAGLRSPVADMYRTRLRTKGMRATDADVNAGIGFVITSLTHLEQTAQSRPYLPNDVLTMFPSETGAPDGAEVIQQRNIDTVGQFGRHSHNGNEMTRATPEYTAVTRPINTGAGGYSYTVFDLMSAAMANIPLLADTVNAARDAYDRHLNTALLYGKLAAGQRGVTIPATGVAITNSKDNNLEGAVANGNLNSYTAPSGNIAWNDDASTPEMIRQDIDYLLNSLYVQAQVQPNLMADTVLYPHTYVSILNRPYSIGGSPVSQSIGEYLATNNTYTTMTGNRLKLMPHYSMSVRFSTQANSNGYRLLAYRNSPEVVSYTLPVPLTFLPPQWNGVSLDTSAYYKYSEVWWKQPLSAAYLVNV